MNDNIEQIYSRTKALIGQDNLDKLKKAKICICGAGGVGSFVIESLARVGVGNITIIDKDNVDITNINRQIIAMVDTIGKSKVECFKDRIANINPNICVNAKHVYISKDNMKEYIDYSFDYVIDAIDDVDAKVNLINYCVSNNINIISSMGMANKLNPCKIKISDVYKTNTCPLAKIMRKKLKEINIKKLKVVYSEEVPIKNEENILGSISFVPSTAGLIIASEVIKDILKEGV